MASLVNQRVLVLADNPCEPDPRILREANSLASAGAEVTILAWQRDSPNDGLTRQNGIVVHRLPPRTRRRLGWRQMIYLLRFYWEARTAALRSSAPTIVIAHDFLLLPLGVLLARRFRCPLIYDAHEIYRWMDAGRLPTWWLRFSGWLEAKLVNHAVSLFVTVSQQRFEDYYCNLINLHPFILGNWYDPLEISKQHARAALGIESEQRFLLGYVGSLFPPRRIDLLLDFAATTSDVRVIVGGRGDPDLIRRIERSASEQENVSYLGWVSNPMQVLAACDAIYYVLEPTHPYAQFAAPNALYLAIALDRPLIAVPLGEIREAAKRSNGVAEIESLTVDGLARALKRARVASSWGSLRSEYTWTAGAKRFADAVASIACQSRGSEYGH